MHQIFRYCLCHRRITRAITYRWHNVIPILGHRASRKSIQIGGIMVAEIMYAEWWKTLAAWKVKGLTKKLYPSALHCASWNPVFMQNLKHIGSTDNEFRFFNQTKKKNFAILWKLFLWTSHTYYIKILMSKCQPLYGEIRTWFSFSPQHHATKCLVALHWWHTCHLVPWWKGAEKLHWRAKFISSNH